MKIMVKGYINLSNLDGDKTGMFSWCKKEIDVPCTPQVGDSIGMFFDEDKVLHNIKIENRLFFDLYGTGKDLMLIVRGLEE